MFSTMSNSNTRIEKSQNLASILDVTRSIKKNKVDDSRRLLVVHIVLRMNQLDQWHDNFHNVHCILLPSIGKVVSTIGNIEQSKRIVHTSSKNIGKRDSLDGGAVTKNGETKDPCFQKEGAHLLLPVRFINCIEILAPNILPEGWLIIRTKHSPNLNNLCQLGIFC